MSDCSSVQGRSPYLMGIYVTLNYFSRFVKSLHFSLRRESIIFHKIISILKVIFVGVVEIFQQAENKLFI